MFCFRLRLYGSSGEVERWRWIVPLWVGGRVEGWYSILFYKQLGFQSESGVINYFFKNDVEYHLELPHFQFKQRKNKELGSVACFLANLTCELLVSWG